MSVPSEPSTNRPDDRRGRSDSADEPGLPSDGTPPPAEPAAADDPPPRPATRPDSRAFQRAPHTRTLLSVSKREPEGDTPDTSRASADSPADRPPPTMLSPAGANVNADGDGLPLDQAPTQRLGTETLPLAERPTTRKATAGTRTHEDFGRYRNVRLLSDDGGMGAVYLVLDPFLERDVALKVVRPDLVARVHGGTEYLERFISEAQIGAQLEHPNILPVHEFGRFADGRVYFTMKYIRGHTLREHLSAIRESITGSASSSSAALPRIRKRRTDRRGSASGAGWMGERGDGRPRVPPSSILRRDLLEKFARLCDAVAFAHSHGVIHRDIKPENVMIGEFGELQLADWGLAKVLAEVPPAARLSRRVPGRRSSTISVPGDAASSASRRVEAETGRPDTRELRELASREVNRIDAEALGTADPAAIGEERATDAERLANQIRLDFERLRRELGLSLSGNEPARTEAGMVMGTIGYMAPEQAGGERVDHRADIFSLGCILYEMVTLTPAFPQEGKVARLRATIETDIVPANEAVSNPQALGDLVPILSRTLQRDADARYQSCSSLAEDVQAVREWRGTQFSSWRTLMANTLRRNVPIVLTAAVMLVAVSVVIGYLLTRPGLVRIASSPESARVYVGDDYLGTTPFEAWLAPGTYELRFVKPDFHEVTNTVVVAPAFRGDLGTQYLRPSIGFVQVTTEPAGARILVRDAEGVLRIDSRPDSRDTGYLWEQLPPGRYEVRCELPHYRDPNGWAPIEIRDGNETTFHYVAMRSARGTALISVPPMGAQVRLVPQDVPAAPGERVEPLLGDVPEGGSWRTPPIPAGTYRVEVLGAPIAGWIAAEPLPLLHVPDSGQLVAWSTTLRTRYGRLGVQSPNVASVPFVLVHPDGREEPFETLDHRYFFQALEAGEYRIELRSAEHRVVPVDDTTEDGVTRVEVVGGAHHEVRVSTRPVVGYVSLAPDASAHGAQFSLRHADSNQPALEPVTLPIDMLTVAPGRYRARVTRDMHYPLTFDSPVAMDGELHAHVTLEPVIKRRWRGPSPGRLDPPGDMELYNVRGDLDGDGANELLIRENDTLLVYSPLRREVVWPPIVMRELWDPHGNIRSATPLFAVVADIDGNGNDDLILAFADQVLGYAAPSGRLAFVRDARGRVTVRGLAAVPSLRGGQRILVVTDRSLICYDGFSTTARWAIELEQTSATIPVRVLPLPEPNGARYAGRVALSDAIHGTWIVDRDGRVERRIREIEVRAVHGETVIATHGDRIVQLNVAALRATESAAELGGERLGEGRFIGAAVVADELAVAYTPDPTTRRGRLLIGGANGTPFELPSPAVALQAVEQGADAALLVVALENGARVFVDVHRHEWLGAVEPSWMRGTSLEGLRGPGFAADVTGSGSDELVWVRDGHLEFVGLERANLRGAFSGVDEVYTVTVDDRRGWLLRTDTTLVYVDADGGRSGEWPITPDEIVRRLPGGQVVVDPAPFAGFQSSSRRPLFAAQHLDRVQPVPVAKGNEAPAGAKWMLRDGTLVRVEASGFVTQHTLAWPAGIRAAWHVPGLGVATRDADGLLRICDPPEREPRIGALLLAYSMRHLHEGREAVVERLSADLLQRLPRSAHAHWIAGSLAAARAVRAAGDPEAQQTHVHNAMLHWKMAVAYNANLVRARFDLANLIAEYGTWSAPERRRIRELLEPVFIARYRYARTVWLLLYEAVRSTHPERVRYFVEIFENTDASVDPEFLELRNPRVNTRYSDVRLWLLRFLE